MSIDLGDWAVRYTTPGGDSIGPVREDSLHVHPAAKAMAAAKGGVGVVLRASGGGWREVATYTDGGPAVGDRVRPAAAVN